MSQFIISEQKIRKIQESTPFGDKFAIIVGKKELHIASVKIRLG
jgi:hypothetical protein